MGEELFQPAEVVRSPLSTGAIGRVERVPLREVWKHEAAHFTPWLAANPDALTAATGLVLSAVETEKSTGTFNVDLVAEDAAGNKVVIENQLEKSDHDHLGKLITYLAAVEEAKTAIWISSDPRPEHVEAVNWLNESARADFYFLKLEAIRIGESPPAPILTLIVGPSEEVRTVAASTNEWNAGKQRRHEFWSALISSCAGALPALGSISPSTGTWIGLGGGRTGINYNLNVRKNDGYVNIYINTGSKELNEQIFDELEAERTQIESELGRELDWARGDELVTSQVRSVVSEGGYKSADADWPSIQQAMVQAMIELMAVFSPRLDSLRS